MSYFIPGIKGTCFSAFLFLLPAISNCQVKSGDCAAIHEGVFYYYPKNTTDEFMETLDGTFEHEKNLRTADTTISRIEWGKNCTFSEEYISGNVKMSLQEKQLIQNHRFTYKITSLTKDYYTFILYRHDLADLPLADDTVWFHPKEHPGNKHLFDVVPNPSTLKKVHFTDTSRYAVIYFYRPGKFTNWLNLYPVYLDNTEMCIAENNSGYIFKILKEGPLKIAGTLFNQPSYTILPVKFGHAYYVKTKVHWGPTKKANHVEIEPVDDKTGKEGFSGVKLRSQ